MHADTKSNEYGHADTELQLQTTQTSNATDAEHTAKPIQLKQAKTAGAETLKGSQMKAQVCSRCDHEHLLPKPLPMRWRSHDLDLRARELHVAC